MLCDKYKDTLIATAANGAALPTMVSKHVSACAYCREALTSQQDLAMMIEREVRSRMNLAVPIHFDHRVRAALEPQLLDRPAAHASLLVFGSIAAVAAVAIVSMLLAHGLNRRGKATPASDFGQSQHLPSNSELAHGGSNDIRRFPVGGAQAGGNKLMIPRNSTRVGRSARDPQVLVPAGQEELVVQYMEKLAARAPQVAMGVDLRSEPEMKPAGVTPVEISQLILRPLPDLSSK